MTQVLKTRGAYQPHPAAGEPGIRLRRALGGLTLQVAGPDGIAHGQARFISGWKDVERPHS
ncbi:hypothetical protein SEA_POUND_153 [Mycobacterium phage Pound]|nr:hypothetical protein SEA_POUND_153 [Mycobacterium phage Pound]